MSCFWQRGILGIVVFTIFGGLLAGCEGEDGGGDESALQIPPPSEGVTTHPVEERIPYHDREAVSITEEQSIEALPDPPQSLRVLASWLQNPQSVDTTHLGFFVDRSSTLDLASIGTERLVLLDGHEGNRLFEYDRRTGETTQIAEPGSGPGELRFAYDLGRDGRSIYVARQDRRIDRFTCEPVPCEYRETIRPPVQVMSVARRPQGIAVVAHPGTGGRGVGASEMSGVIHLLGSAGTVDRAFGPIYLSNELMVLGTYTRGSDLVYSDQFGTYALASERLPQVWVYGVDGELQSVLTVENFRPSKFEYDPDERRRSLLDGISDSVRMLALLNDRVLVLRVDRGAESNARIQYFAIDLETNEPYFVGSDRYGDEIVDRTFFVSEHHQVIVEDGAVGVVE